MAIAQAARNPINSRERQQHVLAEKVGRELTLESYFEVLDKYRSCTCELLPERVSGPFEAKFSVESDGVRLEPVVPTELGIGQFGDSRFRRTHLFVYAGGTRDELDQGVSTTRDELS